MFRAAGAAGPPGAVCSGSIGAGGAVAGAAVGRAVAMVVLDGVTALVVVVADGDGLVTVVVVALDVVGAVVVVGAAVVGAVVVAGVDVGDSVFLAVGDDVVAGGTVVDCGSSGPPAATTPDGRQSPTTIPPQTSAPTARGTRSRGRWTESQEVKRLADMKTLTRLHGPDRDLPEPYRPDPRLHSIQSAACGRIAHRRKIPVPFRGPGPSGRIRSRR